MGRPGLLLPRPQSAEGGEADDGGGGFPSEYDAIRALPGIGDYTAAALASIAFGLPYAVLDGNVMRVMSRVANDAGDVRLPITRRRLLHEATRHLDSEDPATFNQALMELGATLCVHRTRNAYSVRWSLSVKAGGRVGSANCR